MLKYQQQTDSFDTQHANENSEPDGGILSRTEGQVRNLTPSVVKPPSTSLSLLGIPTSRKLGFFQSEIHRYSHTSNLSPREKTSRSYKNAASQRVENGLLENTRRLISRVGMPSGVTGA